MTIVKIIATFGGALLVLVLLDVASGALYSMNEGGAPAYVIETADTSAAAKASTAAATAPAATPAATAAAPATATAPAATPAAPDFTALLASADLTRGKKVFGKCKACHKLDKNAVGPHLDGVVGRAVASVEGFKYSAALQGLGGDWTPERLNQFLTKPKAYVPGTKMGFPGLKKIADRADVIAYLESVAK